MYPINSYNAVTIRKWLFCRARLWPMEYGKYTSNCMETKQEQFPATAGKSPCYSKELRLANISQLLHGIVQGLQMLLSQCRKLPTSLVSHGWVRVQYGGRRSWTDHLTPRAGNTIYNVSDTAKLVITNHHEKKKKKKKNVGFSLFSVHCFCWLILHSWLPIF